MLFVLFFSLSLGKLEKYWPVWFEIEHFVQLSLHDFYIFFINRQQVGQLRDLTTNQLWNLKYYFYSYF